MLQRTSSVHVGKVTHRLTIQLQIETSSSKTSFVFINDIFIYKDLYKDVLYIKMYPLATENWPVAKLHVELVYFQFNYFSMSHMVITAMDYFT